MAIEVQNTKMAVPTVDKSGERVQRMFAGIAPYYDTLNHLLSGGIDIYWRRFTVRTVPPKGEEPILDVCCGTGDLAIAYRQAGAAEVFAVDFCAPMLDRFRAKRDRAGLDGIEILAGDALALPFSENRFQIVAVAFGLRNVADTLGGLREMVRVAQPGGRVVILEFSRPRLWGLRTLYLWYFRYLLPWIGQTFSRSRDQAYNYLPESVLAFPDGDEMLQLMGSVGLVECRQHRLTFGIATLYVGEKGITSP